jgi:ADP-heptose:LPS heptosyltransferase/glycosyltransferase involved in cell wall biosynthesis
MAEGVSPFISVVVLTANRRAALERCLRSLSAQSHVSFEVVVVDNGSTDGTGEWLAQQGVIANLRVVAGDAAESFAEARNRGAAAAHGSLIAFLDDDCEARPDWLALIAEDLAECDAVGGLCEPPPDLRFPRWWHPTMNWTVGLSGPEHGDPALAGSLAYPQTANLALRREVWRHEPFQAIGGRLDGSAGIYEWGREDAELWRRLRLRGYRARFDPRLAVTHHIDPRRLSWRHVSRRARLDGRSLWQRERDASYLDVALGDLLVWPRRAVTSLFRAPRAWIPTYLLRAMWRSRQTAFLTACLAERGLKASARPAGRVMRGWLTGWVKRLVRPVLWLGGRAARGSLWRHVPSAPQHIVVACQGFLGDTVLLGPMIDALRRAWPEARLTLVTNRHGRELHGANPRLDRVVEISAPRFLFGWERWKEIRRTFRRLAPDVVLIPYWHGAPAWPLLISHRGVTVGFDQDMGFRRRLWHDLLDRRVHKDFERREVENLLALAHAVAAPSTELREDEEEKKLREDKEETELREDGRETESLCLPALPAPSAHLRAFLGEHGLRDRPLLTLHIDAVGEGKGWPDVRWAALAQRLAERRPDLPLVFIGLARLSPRVHRLIEDHSLVAINACANRPLADLAALLGQSRLLITTDSGPKHLAMALGTPTLTLYGISSPVRWGAWADRERHRAVISPGWDLRPEELGPRGPDHKMVLIPVEAVEEAAAKMLESPSLSRIPSPL